MHNTLYIPVYIYGTHLWNYDQTIVNICKSHYNDQIAWVIWLYSRTLRDKNNFITSNVGGSAIYRLERDRFRASSVR